jgi:nucleoside-diphosphate-sugar epimerase
MAGKETILITGATGFIGGWLAETLYLSGLAQVRAGIRSWSSAARLARFPVEIVRCNVMDREQIAQAMAEATSVVHCAIGSRDVIIQGTENMLDVSLKSGIRRFVHMSTAEVYGDVKGEIDETAPYQYTGSEYGDSKIEAEKLCWEYYKNGLPVTVLRPSIVYGPFSKDWTLRLARRLQSGNWGIFEGYGEGTCNLVYVADVVSAILLALRHERAVGEAFNLNGCEIITWNQYFKRLGAALGLPELRVISPADSRLRAAILEPAKAWAQFLLDHFGSPLQRMYERFREAKAAMRLAEGSIKTTATRADLNLYSRNAVYLTAKAQKVLGYNPRFNVDAGLRMSVRWLEHLGLVAGDKGWTI